MKNSEQDWTGKCMAGSAVWMVAGSYRKEDKVSGWLAGWLVGKKTIPCVSHFRQPSSSILILAPRCSNFRCGGILYYTTTLYCTQQSTYKRLRGSRAQSGGPPPPSVPEVPWARIRFRIAFGGAIIIHDSSIMGPWGQYGVTLSGLRPEPRFYISFLFTAPLQNILQPVLAW